MQAKSSPVIDLTNPDGVGPSTTSTKAKKAKKAKESKKATSQLSNPPSTNTRQTAKVAKQQDVDAAEAKMGYPKITTQVASDLTAVAAGKINPSGGGQEWAENSAAAGVVQSSPPVNPQSNTSAVKQEVPAKRKQDST